MRRVIVEKNKNKKPMDITWTMNQTLFECDENVAVGHMRCHDGRIFISFFFFSFFLFVVKPFDCLCLFRIYVIFHAPHDVV